MRVTTEAALSICKYIDNRNLQELDRIAMIIRELLNNGVEDPTIYKDKKK